MLINSLNLSKLSDVELDRLIGELIQVLPGERTIQSEALGQSASEEWMDRYPDTISPSFHAYVMSRGGFKSCYSGPTTTVKLEAFNHYRQKEKLDEE